MLSCSRCSVLYLRSFLIEVTDDGSVVDPRTVHTPHVSVCFLVWEFQLRCVGLFCDVQPYSVNCLAAAAPSPQASRPSIIFNYFS